jgi:hypothetical protein
MLREERSLAPDRPPAGRPPTARVNRFGDLVCPHCGVNSVTPLEAIVITGVTRCPACRRRLGVPTRVARLANRRAVDWLRRVREGGARIHEL